MTKEQIKQAAIKHADEIVCENCRESRVYAYITGAKIRQPEIDKLEERVANLEASLDIELK